jgi:hypothetical protein
MHKSGQWMSGIISAPVSKQDAQGVGSATTYCRRYALAAAAGLAQEDDDANAAVGHAKQSAKKEAKPETGTDPNKEHYMTIASELTAALYPADVDSILQVRKVWMDAMPEAGRNKLAAIATQKRLELGG